MGNKHEHRNPVQTPATTGQAVTDTATAVLPAQTDAERRIAELEAALASKTEQLEASKGEIAKLREDRQPGAVTFSIGPKGGIIVRGLSRMGISLYGSQVLRLADEMPRLVDYVKANEDHLCWKVDGVAMAPKVPMGNYGKVWDAKAKAYIDGPNAQPVGLPNVATANAARTMAERDERERQQTAGREMAAAQTDTE